MCEHNCKHQLLLELTYNQLNNNIKSANVIRNSDRNNNSSKIQVEEVRLVPIRNKKQLNILADMEGLGDYYETVMEIHNVEFFNNPLGGRTKIIASDGSELYMIPAKPYKNNIKVTCNCLDFYFRFSVYNKRDDALSGPPPKPYVRRTLHYPPVNPDKVPGLCKHIIALSKYLKNEKILA